MMLLGRALAQPESSSSRESSREMTGVRRRLGRGEVEVAELLRSDHHSLGAVGAGCDPVQLVLELATDHVEVICTESVVHNLDISGGIVSDIEHVVLDDDVHAFY